VGPGQGPAYQDALQSTIGQLWGHQHLRDRLIEVGTDKNGSM
jgi:hypothetical protein